MTPEALDEDPDMPGCNPDTLRMITLRSNDQFNTTVYGYDDRFRGIKGTRDVLLMNERDIASHGLAPGGKVRVETVSKDNILRELGGLTVVPYDIPPGCVGAYYPEANVLLPIWHHAVGSKTPAAKSIPVSVHRQDAAPTPRTSE
jgi:anaerobic selenocysteine-containing dehydrogenase